MPDQLALEYEKVKKALPYVSLGEFPTPVERLPGLEKKLGVTGIYVKGKELEEIAV
jgi:hypothetical protein